jgi:two-component sensor histidine kinase
MGIPAARAALEESVRRVASIALVHETLSMSSDEAVEFDGIVDRVAAAAAEVSRDESRVVMRRTGSFGVLPAEIATPLVMVLNELLLNAAEHGFEAGAGGRVEIIVERDRRQIAVKVRDDGRGLPDDFDPDAVHRLGLQIVRTLVTELRGTIDIRRGEKSGTEALLVFPLDRR